MPATSTAFDGGLRQRLEALLQPAVSQVQALHEGPHQGPSQLVRSVQIVANLIGMFVHLEGSLQQIMFRLYRMSISGSALSQRRARMGSEFFAQIVRRVLGPLADASLHASAFFKGLRLVGIDGSKWSLRNTAQNAQVKKARTRRGAADFGKVLMSTLVELGSHAPLAAAMSWEQGD